MKYRRAEESFLDAQHKLAELHERIAHHYNKLYGASPSAARGQVQATGTGEGVYSDDVLFPKVGELAQLYASRDGGHISDYDIEDERYQRRMQQRLDVSSRTKIANLGDADLQDLMRSVAKDKIASESALLQVANALALA